MIPVSWQEYDHPHEEKSPEWYIVKWIIAVTVALLCIMFGNILLGVLVLVATGTLTLLALRTMPMQIYTVDDTGVYVGNEYIPYDTILSHGFLTGNSTTLLVIGSNTVLHQHILIPVPNDKVPHVRELFNMHAKNPEIEEQEIPLSHTIMEAIGL